MTRAVEPVHNYYQNAFLHIDGKKGQSMAQLLDKDICLPFINLLKKGGG